MRAARILVLGAGGLGCPVAWALAEAGVGTLGVADADVVDLSNLPRQVLHRTSGVGELKVESARRRLERPGLRVRTHALRATARDLNDLLADYDLAIDATDDPATKYALNDAAFRRGAPYIHGGVVGLGGQVATFIPGRTACLRCLFPAEGNEDALPTCTQDGVLGSVAGVIGAVQANEALALVRAGTSPLTGKLLILDALRGFRTLATRRDPECRYCGASPVERPVDGTGTGDSAGQSTSWIT